MEILYLHDQGLKKSQIARRLGIDRGTVAKYLKEPVKAGETPKPKTRARKIDPFLPYIQERLKDWPELTAERLFREIQAQGFVGARRTVRRYVARIRPEVAPKRTYKLFETGPGEQAQVDWAYFGTFIEDGVKKSLYAFIMVLGYSRMRYVEYTTSMDMPTFLSCHQRAFAYFGGVPKVIVYDNAKTVSLERVGKVVRYHPELFKFALYYHFRPWACWVEDPDPTSCDSGVKKTSKPSLLNNSAISFSKSREGMRYISSG